MMYVKSKYVSTWLNSKETIMSITGRINIFSFLSSFNVAVNLMEKSPNLTFILFLL